MSRGFPKGHTGRPAGTKNKLTNDFLTALAKDFAEHGEVVIKLVRIEEPATYFKALVSLMPKELQLSTDNELSGLSDDELAEAIEHIKALRAKPVDQKPIPILISKGIA